MRFSTNIRRSFFVITAFLFAILSSKSGAVEIQHPGPKHIGQCEISEITNIQTATEGKPLVKPRNRNDDLGISFELKNKVAGFIHNYKADLAMSKVGDKMKHCLLELPTDCSSNDDRGRVYKFTNLRTGGSWRLMNSYQICQ